MFLHSFLADRMRDETSRNELASDGEDLKKADVNHFQNLCIRSFLQCHRQEFRLRFIGSKHGLRRFLAGEGDPFAPSRKHRLP